MAIDDSEDGMSCLAAGRDDGDPEANRMRSWLVGWCGCSQHTAVVKSKCEEWVLVCDGKEEKMITRRRGD